MLTKQYWIFYADDINSDWKHALEEGKDVENLKEECISIQKMSNENKENL